MAYRENRAHLAPWDPLREEEFFTEVGQTAQLELKLSALSAGTEQPWLLTSGSTVIGTISLTGIVRGVFLSAHVGYWVDARYQGRGLCSAALRVVMEHARDELGLHRLQASVLSHNAPSRSVLARAGFTLIGTAESYLRIEGRWQDHLLYQRILE